MLAEARAERARRQLPPKPATTTGAGAQSYLSRLDEVVNSPTMKAWNEVADRLWGPLSFQARVDSVTSNPAIRAFEEAAKRDRGLFKAYDWSTKLNFPYFDLASKLRFPAFAEMAQIKSLSDYAAQASRIVGGLGPFKALGPPWPL